MQSTIIAKLWFVMFQGGIWMRALIFIIQLIYTNTDSEKIHPVPSTSWTTQPTTDAISVHKLSVWGLHLCRKSSKQGGRLAWMNRYPATWAERKYTTSGGNIWLHGEFAAAHICSEKTRKAKAPHWFDCNQGGVWQQRSPFKVCQQQKEEKENTGLILEAGGHLINN